MSGGEEGRGGGEEVRSSESLPTSEEYEVVRSHSPSPARVAEEGMEASIRECLEEQGGREGGGLKEGNQQGGVKEVKEQGRSEGVVEEDLSTVLANENHLEDPVTANTTSSPDKLGPHLNT